MDDETVPPERAEILMLRARVVALESAVRALLSAAHPSAALLEGFKDAQSQVRGGLGDTRPDAPELMASEAVSLRWRIAIGTRDLDMWRPDGPLEGWDEIIAQALLS